MSKLRLAFMGTPAFALTALKAIHAAGHDVVAVYSQPPKPAGRGHKLQKSPVQEWAEQQGLIVHTPKTLRTDEAVEVFARLKPDIAVVAAYGLILPKAILEVPRMGCVNIHGSLLPRWRGAAPIQRAILAGDNVTGITIMQMDAGLDTGAMLLRGECRVTAQTTTPKLHDELAAMGAGLIVRALDDLAAGRLIPTPQPSDGVTYAAKLTREDGRLNWSHDAAGLDRQIRALNPWPGCSFMLGDEIIKVIAATMVVQNGAAKPGTIRDDQFTVVCGKGALRLDVVQRPGKPPIDGASFLRGARLGVGAVLNCGVQS